MAATHKPDPSLPATPVADNSRTDYPVAEVRLEDLRRMGILVLDEAPAGGAAVATILEAGGFTRIHIAQTEQIALEILDIHGRQDGGDGIDLILLDVVSPKLGGYRLCRAVHRHRPWREIPIIAIRPHSAWQDDILSETLAAGATDILFRPIHASELIPRVISALLLKRERDARQRHESELEAELAERKVMEARLQYLVSHDDLTGLPNRRRLEQMLESTLAALRAQNRSAALIYIDLDQFKVINDLEGHAAGDRLLMSIANILRAQLQQKHLLARISSDEYAVLLGDTGESEAMALAETLRREIDAFRFRTEDREYQISASLGVLSIPPEAGLTASEALARSAQACFEAKSRGRNLVHRFNEQDLGSSLLHDAVDWVPRIREALNASSFRMLFQPVIELTSGRVIGYEALIRMVNGAGELIAPDQFIPVAERMGLIHDIDLWAVGHAIDRLHGLGPDSAVSINVNLSIYAFRNPALLTLVREKLRETAVDPGRITFEITETAAVENYEQTRMMINHLREFGCRFALDDFGTGFSSFNYLKQFPVDYLKIDGSFINNLLNDPIDQRLVRSMIEVGRALDKQIVAEFVENAETLALLKQYGVHYAQGNYIGKPLSEIPDS
jgi:diguanylate cyclase (GGDEF)-like protein